MRKSIKNLALALLSVVFFIMATVGILTNSNVKSAFAEENPVAVESNFTTTDGASIRITQGKPSGIRWKVTVTEDFHRYVSALGTPTYSTIVNTQEIEVDGENLDAVKIVCSASPKFDKNGVWSFYASIVYDQLANELKDAGYGNNEINQMLVRAYETELYARAFVEVEKADGSTEVIYSELGDTTRSIKSVATYCLIEGNFDAENKADFENIAGKEISVAKTETQKSAKIESVYAEKQPSDTGFEDLGSGTVKTQGNLPAGKYDVLVGAKLVDTITLESAGVAEATISGLATNMYQAGKDYDVSFVAEDGKVYQTKFRYATAIINDGADFKPFSLYACNECTNCLDNNKGACKNPQASDVIEDKNSYFIMSNDILGSVTGVAGYVPNAQKPVYAGLGGTLDGNGYAIRGAELPHGGLFDIVNGGTIKNFAIVDCTLTLWGPIALGAQLNGATLDNVYIDVKYAFNSGAVRAPSAFNACDNQTKITNTVIKTNYTPFDGQDVTSTYGMLNEIDYVIYTPNNPYTVKYDKMLENAENLYYVSANTYIMSVGGTASKRWYGANETDLYNSENIGIKKQFTGVYHYADGTALASAVTELPVGFNADLWKIDATLGLVWK